LEKFQNPIENRRNRGKLYTPNTHSHVHSLSCFDTDTSIKSGRVKTRFMEM